MTNTSVFFVTVAMLLSSSLSCAEPVIAVSAGAPKVMPGTKSIKKVDGKYLFREQKIKVLPLIGTGLRFDPVTVPVEELKGTGLRFDPIATHVEVLRGTGLRFDSVAISVEVLRGTGLRFDPIAINVGLLKGTGLAKPENPKKLKPINKQELNSDNQYGDRKVFPKKEIESKVLEKPIETDEARPPGLDKIEKIFRK